VVLRAAATRTLSPRSTLTLPEYVRSRIGTGTVSAQHELVMLEPTNALALARLAASLWGQSAQEKSTPHQRVGLADAPGLGTGPDDAYVLQAQASVARLNRKYPEALKFFEAALERQPTESASGAYKATSSSKPGGIERRGSLITPRWT